MNFFYDDENVRHNKEEQLEVIEIIGRGYSEALQEEILLSAELIPQKVPKYCGTMERLVFALGNKNEVYTKPEIKFTEQYSNIYVFHDFEKKLNREKINCRTIATRINASGYEAIRYCVEFEKIINKAIDGFNIFFFVANDCVFFGCKQVEKNNICACTLSKPLRDQSEVDYIIENLYYCSDIDDFEKYYTQLTQTLTLNCSETDSFDNVLARIIGNSLSYLEGIEEIERRFGVDLTAEKRHFSEYNEKQKKRSFIQLLEDAQDDASYVESNRINTYEMFFEAEEMLELAEQAEEEIRKTMNQYRDDTIEQGVPDQEATMLTNDPEEMIKILKKRKGI